MNAWFLDSELSTCSNINTYYIIMIFAFVYIRSLHKMCTIDTHTQLYHMVLVWL